MLVAALLSLVATVTIPLMTKAVIDGPVRHQDQRQLWVLGTAAMALLVSEAVLWFIRRWLVARATMGVEADIRKDLYARLQILPMSFHGKWQSGQLLSRVMNDLSTIRQFLSFGLLFLMLNFIQIIVVTAILVAMYWPLGVVVVVSILPITATVLHFQRQFTKLSRAAQDQSGNVATHVEEQALGLRVVKAFGREEYAFERFDERATALFDTEVRKVGVSAKFWTLLEAIPTVSLIVVLGLGAYAAGNGLVTMGTLVAFITMMLSLVWPIASLGFLLSMTQESMTAANRVAEIFDAPREITDGPRPRRPARWPAATRRRRIPVPRQRRVGAASCQRHRRIRRDARPGRVDRFGQVGTGVAAVAALRRDRGCDPARRARHPRAVVACAAAGGGHRVRGPDAVLDVGDGEPHAGQAGRQRRTGRRGRSGRCGRLRLRPAVRPRHPHRRAGHEPVRWAAATARARPRAARRAGHPGARRHAVRARRAHRGRRHRGAEPGTRVGDGCGGRQPRLDRAARRPGGTARGAGPSRGSARTPNCFPTHRNTAICWRPTTTSTRTSSAAATGSRTRTAAVSTTCTGSATAQSATGEFDGDRDFVASEAERR